MDIFSSLDDADAVQALRQGRVGIIPTDTVYGLAALATNEGAVTKLYNLKSRVHKPGTLIAADVDQLVKLGLKRRYLTAVERFWPGAVSVVIPVGDELAYLHQGLQSLAVRIPEDENVREFVQRTGPLLTTSANPPAEPTASTLAEAQRYFGERVDFYVDGGDLSGRPPSTLIRIVDDAIEVLREGAVKINEEGIVQ